MPTSRCIRVAPSDRPILHPFDEGRVQRSARLLFGRRQRLAQRPGVFRPGLLRTAPAAPIRLSRRRQQTRCIPLARQHLPAPALRPAAWVRGPRRRQHLLRQRRRQVVAPAALPPRPCEVRPRGAALGRRQQAQRLVHARAELPADLVVVGVLVAPAGRRRQQRHPQPALPRPLAPLARPPARRVRHVRGRQQLRLADRRQSRPACGDDWPRHLQRPELSIHSDTRARKALQQCVRRHSAAACSTIS